MANIIVLLREESSLSLLENGTASVGGLQVGELGYNEASQEFSYKNRVSSAFRHITTREKMLLSAAAATSGAKGVGYFPASGLTSVTVQDALDELRTQVAAGGGGTVLGSGTVGNIPKFSTTTTLANSILSEASSKIIFSADSVANLYVSASGVLKTDAALIVAQSVELSGPLYALGSGYVYLDGSCGSAYSAGDTVTDNKAAWLMTGNITKNNSITRQIFGLRIRHALNAGGSNLNTTFNLLELDTINTALTGLTVNLMKVSYGGVEVFKMGSSGAIRLADASDTVNKFATLGFTVSELGLLSNRALMLRAQNDYQMTFDVVGTGSFQWQKGGHQIMRLGGSGSGATDNYLEFGNIGNTNPYIKMNACASGKEPTILAAGQFNFFMKNNCLVVQYSDSGTTRYKYLDLSGTGVTWVHSTTAP